MVICNLVLIGKGHDNPSYCPYPILNGANMRNACVKPYQLQTDMRQGPSLKDVLGIGPNCYALWDMH